MFSGMLGLFLPGEYTSQEVYCPIVNILVHLLKRVMRKSLMIHRPSNPPQRNQRPSLHAKMIQAIHDIYAQDRTFLDEVAADLEDNTVWFNNSEFARYHDINGVKILSVFTSDRQTQSIMFMLTARLPKA